MSRKIVIEKIDKKKEKTRTLVELDNDVHSKIAEIAFKTNRSIKEITSILIRDALKYVEIENILEKEDNILKGKWVYREELFDDEDKPRMAYGCSICGHSIKSVHEKRNYCPNCGAKMEVSK